MATILTKKSDTASAVPLAADLTNAAGGAELAVNATDKRLFSKTSGGTVVELGTNPTAMAVVGNTTVGGTLGVTGATTLAGVSATTLSASSTVTLSGGTANGVPYLNGSKVLTSGSALVFDGTNFGVGTASPASKLSVYGTSGDSAISFFGSAGTPVGYMGSTSVGNYIIGALANETFIRSSVGTAFSSDNGASVQMRLNTSGNLGIGVASPAYKLDVNGTAGISGNVTLSGGTANGVAYLNGSKVVTSGSALTFDGTNLLVGSGTAVSLSGYTMLSQAKGSFGIVSGNDEFAGAILRESSSTNSISIQADPANLRASSFLGFGVDGSEGMRLTSTGLGIGTSSPAQKLHIKSSGSTKLLINSSDNSADRGVYFASSTDSDVLGYISQEYSTGNFTISAGTGSYAVPMIFRTGGSERMRLDSSGNLGLGVTPSAWGSTYRALQVGLTASLVGLTNDTKTHLSTNARFDGTDWRYIATSPASRYAQIDNQHQWFNAPSGTAGNAITFTQAMTLDASGNLGVGTTSPSSFLATQRTLVIGSGSGDVGQTIYTGSSSQGTIAFADGLTGDQQYRGYIAYIHSSDALTFGSAGAERARIDSSGNLLVGTTNTTGGALVNFYAASTTIQSTLGNTTSAQNHFVFANPNGNVGTIQVSGSSTSFNTSSDYRLKNTIAPMTGALAKVALLKPCTYKWNVDGSDGQGFIAHELAEVVPQCVTGEKDAVDEEGNPKYQGIDTSFLVATLTAAIQELKAEFDAYKASHP